MRSKMIFKFIGLQHTLQIDSIANASGKSIFDLQLLSLDATEQYTSIVDNQVENGLVHDNGSKLKVEVKHDYM